MVTVTAMGEELSIYPPSITYFLGLVSRAAKNPTAIPHHRNVLRQGQKGINEMLFCLNRDWVLFVACPESTRREDQPSGLSWSQPSIP